MASKARTLTALHLGSGGSDLFRCLADGNYCLASELTHAELTQVCSVLLGKLAEGVPARWVKCSRELKIESLNLGYITTIARARMLSNNNNDQGDSTTVNYSDKYNVRNRLSEKQLRILVNNHLWVDDMTYEDARAAIGKQITKWNAEKDARRRGESSIDTNTDNITTDDVVTDTEDHSSSITTEAKQAAADGKKLTPDQLAALQSLFGGLSEEDIRNIVQAELKSATDTFTELVTEKIEALSVPVRVIVEHRTDDETTEIDVGVTHYMFPVILATVRAGDPVFLVGPAGTGKTHLASQVAHALGLSFYTLPCHEAQLPHEILGFMSVDKYMTTPFRISYDAEGEGGLFLADEFDAGNSNTSMVYNAGLANGEMGFPDKMVKRHSRFCFIAAGNTFGTGPNRQFVGRNQLDFATLDRFSVIEVPVDQRVEASIVGSTLASGPMPVAVEPRTVETGERDSWVKFIRSLRQNATDLLGSGSLGSPIDFTPRAVIQGIKLLEAGLPTDQVIAQRVRKGLSDQDWEKLTKNVSVPK